MGDVEELAKPKVDEALLKNLKALKYYERKTTELEINFYNDVHELEKKFNKLFEEVFIKREEITSGKREPEREEIAEGDIVTARLGQMLCKNPRATGVPNFWFWVFKNSAKLYEMVQRSDVPILSHLLDIKLIYRDDPMGFVLEFRFDQNNFFSNDTLTKEYSGALNDKEGAYVELEDGL